LYAKLMVTLLLFLYMQMSRPVMHIGLLFLSDPVDPPLDIDITHLLPSNRRLVQYHIFRVPNHNTQLVPELIQYDIDINRNAIIHAW